MKVGPLLPGEIVLYRGLANLIISPKDFHLPDFALTSPYAPLVLGTIGETIGGRLYVTDSRLVFSAHALNRVNGRLSVPHAVEKRTAPFREGLAFGVAVDTELARHRFVSWSAAKCSQAVRDAKRMRESDVRGAALNDERLSELEGGLRVPWGVRPLSVLATLGKTVAEPPDWIDLMSAIYLDLLKKRSKGTRSSG